VRSTTKSPYIPVLESPIPTENDEITLSNTSVDVVGDNGTELIDLTRDDINEDNLLSKFNRARAISLSKIV
jgi:hypothetical protein